MTPRRWLALASSALSLGVAGCSEKITGPDGTADAFSLLIERRNAGGQRSFYTLGATNGVVAPFIGVPSDARTLIPSPDGKTIAYLREADGFVGLWAMDRDGANRRAILDGSFYIESAAWSPDGKQFAIAYSTDNANTDIATLNADGTGLVDLTPDPLPGVYADRDPAWSPSGTRIAFSSNRSGVRHLWIMNADGRALKQLVPASSSSTERNPVWSPDGAFIAAVATTTDGNGITFVRPDATDWKHVVIAPAASDPVWLPDGRLLYVANPTGDYDLYALDRVTGVSTQVTSRRDQDVRAAVLTYVAPFAWLGFSAPATYPINRPLTIAIDAADVLNDGFRDLLVLSPTLNELRVMRGSSSGSYLPVGSLFAESKLVAMTTAVFTLDLVPDIVARSDSALFLWRGRTGGPGTSSKIPLDGIVRDAVIVDADGSGREDIVSLVENGTQPFRLTTHTIGATDFIVSAINATTTRSNGRSMCAGDMNNDGRPDLLILAGATSLMPFIAEGSGELGFGPLTPAGLSLSTDVTATPLCADFNGDGRDDVALLSAGQASGVSVQLMGSTNLFIGTKIPVRGSSMVAVDIDRDGDVDLVIGGATTAELFIVKNRGDGRFDTPASVALANIPTRLLAKDLNGDNWPDVVVLDAVGSLVVLLSRGRAGM